MSWTDKQSLKHIRKLKDLFEVETFVETGTFMGTNARHQAENFEKVITCEIDAVRYLKAKSNLVHLENVKVVNEDSPKFLKKFKGSKKPTIFYLDAHFDDPNLPKGKKFVVIDEIKSLRGCANCIIIIHDFDNNLGHITYEGIPLDMKLLKSHLLKVNKKFKFYTNELDSCDIKKIEEAESMDELDNLRYVWSSPGKTYRGILYCVPREVDIDGLRIIK